MEYIVYCYNVLAPDKERIVRSFEKHAELQLIDIRSLEGLKKIYSEDVSGQVFLAFSGNKVGEMLPVLKEIRDTFPDLPVICVGDGLNTDDIALIRGSAGTVNYIERSQLDSLYEVICNIWDKKSVPGEVTEKEVIEQYEFLLDVSDSYLSMIGRNYTYLAINDAFSRAHNIKRHQLIGSTPVKLWGEQTFNRVIKPYLDQSFSKKDIHYRAWFEVPGKEKRFFEVLFRPHVNEAGEVDYVVVSSKDITSEEEAKEQIRRHNEDINLLNVINRMSNDKMPLEHIAKTLTENLLDLFQAFTWNIYFHDDKMLLLRKVWFGIRDKDYSRVKNVLGLDIKRLSKGFDNRSFLYNILKSFNTVHVTKEEDICKIIYEVENHSPQVKKHIQGFRENFPVKAVLVVPLRYRSEKLGIMLVSRFVPFSTQEIERINRLANQISMILKHDKEERQYKEQSEKIRLLFETAQDAILIMDRYTLLDCNAATLKLFGARKKEMLGKTPLDFSPPIQPDGTPSAELASKYIRNVLKGKAQTFEWMHSTLTGKPFYTQVKLNRLPLDDKFFIQAVIRDIDEEKKNRIKLEESEESLLEAQRIARLGDWSWDVSSGKIRWSEELFHILGLDPSRDVPSLRLLLRYIHPEDRQRVIHKIVNATRECRKCEDQFRLLLTDGSVKYIKSSGVLKGKKGKYSFWHGVIQDVTGLVEAENALRVSENRFRTIFSESFYAMSLLTGNGSFIDANKSWTRLFGYSQRELKKLNCFQLIPEEDKKEVGELFLQLREGKKESYTGEKRYLHKDGSMVWTQTGITAIRNEDGTLKHLVTTLVNITDRKKAEEKILMQSRELNLINRMNLALNKGKPLQHILKMVHKSLKTIFPVQNILIFLKDSSNGKTGGVKLVYWSFTEKQILRAQPYVGTQVVNLFLTDKSSLFLREIINKMSPFLISDPKRLYHGIEKYFEYMGRKISGREIAKIFDIRSMISYPIMKKKTMFGAILLFSNHVLEHDILADISRLMEQTNMIILKKMNEVENQRLYTAIEHMNEVLIISDKTGKILYVNEAFFKMTGKKRKEVIGIDTRSLRNPEVDVSVYQNIWDTVLAGKVWTGVLSVRNKDGEVIPVRYHISPIKNEQDEIVHFVTVMRDVSQEITLERYMQRSQKLEMIGRFAGGLAHDFNNILATMLGYNDMVMEEADKRSREYMYLKKIKASGMKAQEIIQQLLTFNRGIEPKKEKINPVGILQESLNLMAPQIPKKVTVDFEQDRNVSNVLADPVQLRQVFLNLVSNAVHALENQEKDGRLKIEMKSVIADQKLRQKVPDLIPGRYLQILFQDNGVGMEKNVLDKIFEPFFTTKPVGKGSGMGLSVVHGIIKNHDGAVHIESQPGMGTSFWVYLPLI
ncbi:MAG: PAS domain S-box protein [Bacteroidales bacterium]|nr:PAS domain S-box protein [Bacteroidales bacterium]